MNLLVGPNNAGKSTVIAAMRLLGHCLRIARNRRPEAHMVGGKLRTALPISTTALPVAVESIHTDYEQKEAQVLFRLSNRCTLEVSFSSEAQPSCHFLASTPDGPIISPGQFRSLVPFLVGIVPTPGPAEQYEPLVQIETADSNIGSHRFAGNFRNYWRHHAQRFPDFQALLRTTWPSVSIDRPAVIPESDIRAYVAMNYFEERIPRELYWSGFGFQAWCQILTHLVHFSDSNLLVLDEPETFLHPTLQRRLVALLREQGRQVIVATHSAEILAEVDSSDLRIVDKAGAVARRVNKPQIKQRALDALGSHLNVTLAELSRTRKLLFVEGQDMKVLGGLARRAGLPHTASQLGFSVVPIEGFDRWPDIPAFAGTLQKIIGEDFRIIAVLDSDNRPPEQLSAISAELANKGVECRFHERREVENYLLCPVTLQRAIDRAMTDQERGSGSRPKPVDAARLLIKVTDDLRDETRAEVCDRALVWVKLCHSGEAQKTTLARTNRTFDDSFESLEGRIRLVAGKSALARFNHCLQSSSDVSLSEARIIDAMAPELIPEDMVGLLRLVETMATTPVEG
jgi:hypothetical protein